MIINVILMLFVIWICVYSASYGVWTCKQKNWLGGIMVMVFAIIAVILPFYILFVL